MYQLSDKQNAHLSHEQLEAFLQKAKKAVADIEIAGNKLYIVQPDGLQMTPQGMELLFQLIKDVNLFD